MASIARRSYPSSRRSERERTASGLIKRDAAEDLAVTECAAALLTLETFARRSGRSSINPEAEPDSLADQLG